MSASLVFLAFLLLVEPESTTPKPSDPVVSTVEVSDLLKPIPDPLMMSDTAKGGDDGCGRTDKMKPIDECPPGSDYKPCPKRCIENGVEKFYCNAEDAPCPNAVMLCKVCLDKDGNQVCQTCDLYKGETNTPDPDNIPDTCRCKESGKCPWIPGSDEQYERCRNKVQGNWYPPTNGCTHVPDDPCNLTGILPDFGEHFPGTSFEHACNEHDVAYGSCRKSKKDADDEFLADMIRICKMYQSDDCLLPGAECEDWAKDYANAVKKFAQTAYDTAQRKHCICCDGAHG